MAHDSGRSTSIWMATSEVPSRPPLTQDPGANVCVIGAGIAGLTTAYLLGRAGKAVVVLDDGPIAGGMTQRTAQLQAHYEAGQTAQREETYEFTAQYAQRAGVEGTHVQGIRRCGLRHSRHIRLAKTHPQHLITAVALNVARLDVWWLGTPQAKTRRTPFAVLRVGVA